MSLPGVTIIRFGSPECKILSGKDLASSKPEVVVYNTFIKAALNL